MDQKPYQTVLCDSFHGYCENNLGEMGVLGANELQGEIRRKSGGCKVREGFFPSLNLRGAYILAGAITAALGNTPVVVNGIS